MALTKRNLLARIVASVVAKATEGASRAGPWNLPVSGGVLTPGPPGYGDFINWWQLGGSISGGGISSSAMVEACVSAYAQTVAMCPGAHWRLNDLGGRDRVENSALSRILRHPNAYQSSSDFLLALTRSLYLEGNAYAVAIRNNRFEVDELHLMDPRQSSPQVTEDGDVFYRLSGNDVISRQIWGQDRGTWSHLLVPQRDVLHVRLNTYERTKWPWPLLGESPLIAAYGDIAWFDRIRDQQSQFFQNQARPSAVLTTDLVLDRDQVQNLRDRWNEQSKGLHAGGVPILTGGLKVHQWAESKARDMQIAEQLQLTRDQIALVFRIPLAVLGLGRTPISSTEALMGQWKSMGLGFCLNHIEEAFGILFDLRGQPYEYCEFDTEALLRTARKERIDALARAVQGGIYSPNEARAKEDLPAVKAGEEPRVQQQVVPLSFASSGEIPPAPPASSTTPPAAPIAASTSNVMIDVRSVFERARKFDLASL